MNSFRLLADFFYPPRCLVCDKTGAVVHAACRAALPFMLDPLCSYCGAPLAFARATCRSRLCETPVSARPFQQVRSVFRHEAGARQAVLRLKYKGVSSLVDWMVAEMAGAIQRHGLEECDSLIAVPLHPSRLHERGYNQAELLATGLARYLGQTSLSAGLVRIRQTRSQVGLNATDRAANVRAAFQWNGPSLAGQSLLLLDDVCTTGATLAECAHALRQAGAKSVSALTFTRETSA